MNHRRYSNLPMTEDFYPDQEVSPSGEVQSIRDHNLEKKKTDEEARFEHDKEEFPEGGFGWVVVFAGWMIMTCTFGMVNSFGIYQTHYATVQFPHERAFKISLIGSLQVFSVYISSIPTVLLLHHFNSRICVLLGSLIQIFSLMMMSLTTEMWQLFLSQGLLFGIGGGILYSSAVLILMEWFKVKRAVAMGITSSGSSMGGVYWPFAVRYLILEVGIDWTNRIIGFIYIPMCCVMIYGLKTRLPKEKDLKFTDILNFRVLKDWKFITLVLMNVIGVLGLFPGLFYIDLYSRRMSHINGNIRDNLVSILNAASLFGRVIPGFLADKYGRMNVAFPFLVLSGVFPLLLWLPASHSQALLLVYSILWGFTSGVFISLIPTLVTQLFGVHDTRSRMSFFFGAASVAGLFGPMICGSFIPLDDLALGLEGFNKLIIFVGVMMLGCAATHLLLRLTYSRKLDVFI